MPHIRGYLKRKEEKERIWKEVFQELNKPDEDTLGQGLNFGGQVVKLPGTSYTQPQIKKLPFASVESGQSVPLDYAKRAASGWAQFKAETDHQQILLRDPNYQKWQKAMGMTAQDDADQYPKSNWSFSQNNQFGYLYSHNPEEAKQFAKLVNAEYGNTPTMISDAAAMEEETVAEDMGVLKDAWGNFVDTLAANSTAAMNSGQKIAGVYADVFTGAGELETANANVGKLVGDNAADDVLNVVANAANIGGNLAGAQANSGKTTVDTVMAAVPEVLQSFVPPSVEPPKTNEPIDIPLPEMGLVGADPKKDPILLTPMEAMMGVPANFEEIAALGYQQWKGDHNDRLNMENSEGYQAYLDFIAKNNYAGTPEGMAAAQKLLGPGYTIEEPQPNWSVAENNRFGYLYYTNPAAAAAYARSVNERYAVEEEQKTAEWVKDHQGLAMAGSWITDRLGLAETLDSELYYAQYGQLPYTWQVTPSRFSEIVGNTMKNDVLTGDPVNQLIYGALDFSGDAAYQAYLAKLNGGIFGSAVGAVESYGDAYNAALYEARLQGMTGEEAVAYARRMAISSGVGNIASTIVGKFLPQGGDVKSSVTKEGISNMVGGVVSASTRVNDRYDELMEINLRSGMTKEEADYAAKLQVLQELGMSALYDLSMGMAYGLGRSDNEVRRSLTRK